MRLNLREIIEIPGASVPFECELAADGLDFPSIERYVAPPRAEGRVYNEAGVLRLGGSITADMLCICDRCGRSFEKRKTLPLKLKLAADMENDDDPDIFPVENNGVDLDELLRTCFILDMETKFLCSDDCKGLCSVCGRNLNDGPCACTKQTDPRLAVLGQLLDIDDK